MNARIAKLESLLTRIQQRAGEPRLVAQAGAAPTLDLDEPSIEAPVDELDAPVLDAPELDAPMLDTPELDAPDLDAPELDAPELETAALDQPELDVPDLDAVELDAPIEDLDEEISMDEIDEVEDLDDVVIEDEVAPESGAVASSAERSQGLAPQPPLTPPPESGEEVTDPAIPPREGPTMEQLGQTIALEEGADADLELDEPISGEKEPSLQSGSIAPAPVGTMDPSAHSPAEAEEDLARHRQSQEPAIAARVSARPLLSSNVVEFASAAKTFEPKSFKELLEASLSLK